MKLLTDNLEIGTLIYELVNDICNCYPIIADKGSNYPFCVYRRTGFVPKNSKDIYNYEEIISFEIIIACTKYKESIQLAQQVKDKLENYRGIWRTTKVNQILMDNCNEDWSNDAYIQRMYFTISLDNKPARR